MNTFTFGDDATTGKNPGKLLTVELVPLTSWKQNLHAKYPKSLWDKLRKSTYRRAGYVCEICGESGKSQGYQWPVECHEVWEYTGESQKLVGLIALCPLCHAVKHAGRSIQVGGDKAVHQVLFRLASINRWSRNQALSHLKFAFAEWEARSRQDWALDLSWLDSVSP